MWRMSYEIGKRILWRFDKFVDARGYHTLSMGTFVLGSMYESSYVIYASTEWGSTGMYRQPE